MDTQKALEMITSCERIGILIPPKPSWESLTAAEGLICALEENDKRIGLVGEISDKQALDPDIHTKLAHPPAFPRDWIISLKTKNAPVSQLRYEKREDEIDIILSPLRNPPRPEDVIFKEGEAPCDCVIALEADPASIPRNPAENATLTPVIALGVRASRPPEDGIIYINSASSLAETAASLMLSWEGAALPERAATFFLAGMLSSMDAKGAPPSAQTISTASALLEKGARYEEALAYAERSIDKVPIQLLGRALTRSRMDHERAFLWSFLTADDFAKTGGSEKDACPVLLRAREEAGAHAGAVLIWQDASEKNIRAFVAGPEPFLRAMQERIPSSDREQSCLALAQTFTSFQEAERALAALIEQAL